MGTSSKTSIFTVFRHDFRKMQRFLQRGWSFYPGSNGFLGDYTLPNGTRACTSKIFLITVAKLIFVSIDVFKNDTKSTKSIGPPCHAQQDFELSGSGIFLVMRSPEYEISFDIKANGSIEGDFNSNCFGISTLCMYNHHFK